jgi:hypothetical protein
VFDSRSNVFKGLAALRRSGAGVFALFFIIFYAHSPNAQIIITGRFAVWETFSGTASDGRPVCGLNSTGGARSVYIKHFGNDNFFTVQVFNSDWRFGEVAPVRVALQFGSNYLSDELSGWAHPGRGAVSSPFVEVWIRYSGSSDFWNSFRWASQGRLIFLTGNEGSWNINLSGSNAATSVFARCVGRLLNSTQPFDAPPGQPPEHRGTKNLDTMNRPQQKTPF